jgi:valyl-tRNA synthetase
VRLESPVVGIGGPLALLSIKITQEDLVAAEEEQVNSSRADEARARLQGGQETREAHGLPPSPQFAHPGAEEVSHRRETERYARQAEKYEEKAKRIRELLASGKIAPDSEEVREKLRQRREEAQARLRELEQAVRSH